jgi:hypothetical protein
MTTGTTLRDTPSSFPKRELIFQYVRHPDVPAYEAVGWIRRPGLDGTHHGRYSALCEWGGEGEPVTP